MERKAKAALVALLAITLAVPGCFKSKNVAQLGVIASMLAFAAGRTDSIYSRFR